MNVLSTLGVIFLLAFLVESLTEYLFGQLVDHVPALTRHKWALIYVSMAIGVLGAFVYQFDLIYLLGQFLGADTPHHWLGVLFTGAAVGRGANYLHDLVTRYFVKPG